MGFKLFLVCVLSVERHEEVSGYEYVFYFFQLKKQLKRLGRTFKKLIIWTKSLSLFQDICLRKIPETQKSQMAKKIGLHFIASPVTLALLYNISDSRFPLRHK